VIHHDHDFGRQAAQRWQASHRAGLGTLTGEAQPLRTRLAKERGLSAPGAPALTATELRLPPLLSTHVPFPEIASEMFLSRNTIKSQANSIYPKLGAGSRGQRSPGPAS